MKGPVLNAYISYSFSSDLHFMIQFFLYSVGEIPQLFLNIFMKFFSFSYPTFKAIS